MTAAILARPTRNIIRGRWTTGLVVATMLLPGGRAVEQRYTPSSPCGDTVARARMADVMGSQMWF